MKQPPLAEAIQSDDNEYLDPAALLNLARIRKNLESLKLEISSKILSGVDDLLKETKITKNAVQELSASLINQNQ